MTAYIPPLQLTEQSTVPSPLLPCLAFLPHTVFLLFSTAFTIWGLSHCNVYCALLSLSFPSFLLNLFLQILQSHTRLLLYKTRPTIFFFFWFLTVTVTQNNQRKRHPSSSHAQNGFCIPITIPRKTIYLLIRTPKF